jgi:HSP20 family molecular chaperone IbpA
MFDMGSLLSSIERDMNRLLRHFGAPGLDLLCPSVVSETGGTEGSDGKYRLNVPLGRSIGPEDVKIGIKDKIMTIEAKKEQKSEDGNCRVYQEYVRKFTLPENIDTKEVKSVLTPEGYLQIEAPLPLKKLEEPKKQEALAEPKKPCPIPIEMK